MSSTRKEYDEKLKKCAVRMSYTLYVERNEPLNVLKQLTMVNEVKAKMEHI